MTSLESRLADVRAAKDHFRKYSVHMPEEEYFRIMCGFEDAECSLFNKMKRA